MYESGLFHDDIRRDNIIVECSAEDNIKFKIYLDEREKDYRNLLENFNGVYLSPERLDIVKGGMKQFSA